MKRILFVDDEPRILDGLRRMLRAQRHEWEMTFASGGDAALAEVERAPVDVVVTDMRMPGLDGVGLLTGVQHLHPQTLRIVLSGHTDAAVAARAARVAHQFLFKPSSPDVVRAVVERGCALAAEIPEPLRALVGRIGAFPVAEDAYRRLGGILEQPDPSHEALVEVVERDPGISAKVLQIINSSFFGISPEVADIASAVRLLGPRTMRELVCNAEVFRPIRTEPERDARRAAGMLHDIGERILWDAMPEQYTAIRLEALRSGVPVHVVEEAVLGTTHARLGAYLLGIWNLPHAIVDAVAHHHDEPGGESTLNWRASGVAAPTAP
jgi:HD-like signal output (HDOD) protein/CheY-like chemotaxis protein